LFHFFKIFLKAWILSCVVFSAVYGIVKVWIGDTRGVLMSILCFVINVMIMEYHKSTGLWNK
jgi:hypothetical protein